LRGSLTQSWVTYAGSDGCVAQGADYVCRTGEIPVGGSIVITIHFQITGCDPQQGYFLGPALVTAGIDWPWYFPALNKMQVIGC
jgi:hypothetical protein